MCFCRTGCVKNTIFTARNPLYEIMYYDNRNSFQTAWISAEN